MEEGYGNIDKSTTRLSHILLPTCNEAEGEDVFLNVLKRIFSRSKYKDSYLDDAFKLGMSGNVFSIDDEDLSMNWKQLNSEEQQTRQAKLLGFWAVENFPSLGKQLWGPLWHAKAKSLQANNHSNEISADEINAMILKKLKLRVLKLNVCNSTLNKLMYFVKVPETITKRNESQISKKIKAFDIDDQWIEHCWKALKLGGFSLAFEQQLDLIETLNRLESLPNRENVEQTNGGNCSSSVAPKRTYLDTLDFTLSVNGDSSIGASSIQAPKRAYIANANVNDEYTADINVDLSTGSQPVLASTTNGNARCNNDDSSARCTNNDSSARCTKNDLSIDYQASILSLRNDIRRLTDMFQSTIQEGDSEMATGQERLHIIVINQKDGEIAQLKATVQELRQVNDGLMKDQLKTIEQIGKQAVLMNVLQKGAEANWKLHEQSDRNLMEKLNLIKRMKRQIADAATTKQKMDDKLSAANRTIEKLRYEQTAGLVELKAQIETLNANLTAAEQIQCDTTGQKVKLQEELDALKRYTVSIEEELENMNKALTDSATTKRNMEHELSVSNQTKDKLRDEVNTLKEQTAGLAIELKAQIDTLDANLIAAEQMNCDKTGQKVKLQEELDALKRYTVSIEKELENMNKALTDSATTKRNMEHELSVSNQTKDKLRDEVNTLKEQSAGLAIELKAQIETLNANLTAAEQIQCDTTGQKVKLQEELDALKRYTVSIEEELENMNEALTDSATTKRNMEHELSVSNQTKDKLRDEVNTLKEQTAGLAIELKAQIDTLDANLIAAEQMNCDKTGQKVKLQEELDALKRYTVSIEKELENMNKALTDSATTKRNMEHELSVSNQTKHKLRDEVNTLKEQTAGLAIELKAQIDTLDANLIAAEQMNCDKTGQKVKLQEELDSLKRYTVRKEEELENLHKSFSELHNYIDWLENRKKTDLGTQTVTCNEMGKLTVESEMSGIEPSDMIPNDSLQTVSVQCNDAQGESDFLELLPQPFEKTSAEDKTIDCNITRNDMKSTDNVQSVNIQCDDEQGESDNQELLPQPVEETSAKDETIDCSIKRSGLESNDSVRDDNVSSDMFATDDPIVQQCREKLKALPFGWVKYKSSKHCKYVPGFIHPVDPDGYIRAQEVTGDGYVDYVAYKFFEFAENVSDNLKKGSGVSALKKFNEKFHFSYV